MPTNVQSLLVLLLFVLPGFVAVEVIARIQPSRERSTFDKTALSVLYSTIVHVVLVPILTCIAIWCFGFEPRTIDAEWLSERMREQLPLCEAVVVGYFVLATLCGVGLGFAIAKTTGYIAPVWAQETYIRVQHRGRLRRLGDLLTSRRYRAALAVFVIMKNGDRYVGLLKTLPGDFEDLQRKDKFFSIQRVTYAPNEGLVHKLEDGQVVLLNTDNVDAMWIGEEPLVSPC